MRAILVCWWLFPVQERFFRLCSTDAIGKDLTGKYEKIRKIK